MPAVPAYAVWLAGGLPESGPTSELPKPMAGGSVMPKPMAGDLPMALPANHEMECRKASETRMNHWRQPKRRVPVRHDRITRRQNTSETRMNHVLCSGRFSHRRDGLPEGCAAKTHGWGIIQRPILRDTKESQGLVRRG